MKLASRLQQSGAALLAAMLTVTLVASFATAAAWQQWRAVEVETAERQRVQAGWLLVGALGFAHLLLREDRDRSRDDFTEPWSIPLKETRLSSFLAADKNNNVLSAEDESAEVYLSGQIMDAQSSFNLKNLVQGGKVHKPSYDALNKLFLQLGLDERELLQLADNWRFATDTSPENQTATAAFAPLPPQRVEELEWLGVSSATLLRLGPYISILPKISTLNVNTAPAELIYAAVPTLKLSEAKSLVERRQGSPFRSMGEVSTFLGNPNPAVPFDLSALSVNTSYFSVRGQLRLNNLVVQERSLVEREGSVVTTIWRERTALALDLGPNAKQIGPEGSLQ